MEYGNKLKLKFNGSCLKQDKITYSHGKIVNIYIVYEISKNYNIRDYPTLENCLFGAVSLIKNADFDNYKYFGYGIGFDRHGFYSHLSGGTGKNLTIFGVDMSSSTKIDSKKKDILILGKGPTQGLGEHSLTAEKMYSINFTENNNGANTFLFVNGKEIYKFKAKDSEIVPSIFCLGNVSKDFSADNMEKTRSKGYVYDFIVDITHS